MDELFIPTYLSIQKLEQLFELFGRSNFNEVKAQDFITRGFSKSDATLAIQTSKFLGFITSEGKSTDSSKVLWIKGEERQIKLKEVVKVAYRKLYETTPNAEQLNRDQLENEFIAIYGLSPRTVRPAVLAYLWLSSQAGIETKEAFVARSRNKESQASRPKIDGANNDNASRKKTKANPGKPEDELGNEYFTISILNIPIKLILPKNELVEDAIAAGELAEVRKKIIEFAEKIGLSKKEDTVTDDNIAAE